MEGSKIFVHHVPSLSHLAVVQHAIKLSNYFNISTLVKAFNLTQKGNAVTSEDNESYKECERAQIELLLIPPLLRMSVMEAIHGLKSRKQLFVQNHLPIINFKNEKCNYRVKSDGTIDTVKMAQEMVLDSNIDIKKRFYLACMHCLGENVQTLWSEMEKTGEAEKLDDALYWLFDFWVRWLKDGCQESWNQTIWKFLIVVYPAIRISSFFDSLRPEERENFFHRLMFVPDDDFLLCLFDMTKEEEVKILKSHGMKVLYTCFQWPMRSLLLEKAEEILKYVDSENYCDFLEYLFSSEINREAFDFHYFFTSFWKCSPNHLTEKAKELPHLREKIELYFPIQM